jgi:hypothetical protein
MSLLSKLFSRMRRTRPAPPVDMLRDPQELEAILMLRLSAMAHAMPHWPHDQRFFALLMEGNRWMNAHRVPRGPDTDDALRRAIAFAVRIPIGQPH